jgi:hypothetical protein
VGRIEVDPPPAEPLACQIVDPSSHLPSLVIAGTPSPDPDRCPSVARSLFACGLTMTGVPAAGHLAISR